MDSTKELRQKLQAFKYEGRERPWGYRALQRGPSIYITRFAIKHDLTPNQITLAGIICGIIGSFLVFFALPFKIAGAILLYANILSDKVDGETARFRIQEKRGKVYLRGVYLDELNHLIIPPLFLLGVTLGIISNFPYNTSILAFTGLFATLSLPFLRVYHSLAPQIFMKKYIKHPELFSPLPHANEPDPIFQIKKKYSPLKKFIQAIHQLQDFFIIVFLLFLSFLGEITMPMFRPHLLSGLLVVILGIILPLIVIENSIKGFFQIEHRVRDIKDKYWQK